MEPHKEIKSLAKDQIQVGISKFSPSLSEEHISREINLPSGYGKDRIVAMVRDPWWIFVYWEITPQREEQVKEQIKKNKQNFKESILRVYDVVDATEFNRNKINNYFDITLKDMARNWYVDMGSPGRHWCVEIGLVSKEGDFYALAKSNIVTTPRFGISDILDEQWMLSQEECWWLLGASSGFDLGKSSQEMRQLFLRQLKEWISSGALFSFGSHILQQKK